ncbi:hypothetical protein KR222_006072, partial [Zaprionus bogoriensis]
MRLLPLLLLVLCPCLQLAHGRPLEQQQQERTAGLPLLLLLGYPSLLQQQVGGSAILPGIPIRRPHDELSPLADELAKPPKVQSDEPQMDAMDATDANALIREQFIQGVLQGLQTMASAQGGPTVQPAVLADFLAQVQNAARTTVAPPGITPPPVEKDAQLVNNNEHDADYDYIDFKNGSRIKYELDSGQLTNNVQYPNKILQ